MKKFLGMFMRHPKITCILAVLIAVVFNICYLLINATYFKELQLLMPSDRFYSKSNYDYDAPSAPKFYPAVMNRLEGMAPEWLVMKGSNSLNGAKDITMYYNLDTQEFTSVAPTIVAKPIIQICLSENWKRIEDLKNGEGIFSGEVRVLDAQKQTEIFTINLPIQEISTETDMQFAIGFANDNYLGVEIDSRQFYINVHSGDMMEMPPVLVDYNRCYVAFDGNLVIGSKEQGKGSSLYVWEPSTNKQFSLDGLPEELAYATPNLEHLFYRDISMLGGIEFNRYYAKVLDVNNRSVKTLYKTWDTIQIEDNPWITNELLGLTTRDVRTFYARETLIRISVNTGDIVIRKIPLSFSKSGKVYYDSAGNYAHFISKGRLYRVSMR